MPGQIPDPARPGQFVLEPSSTVTLSGAWPLPQSKKAVQVETFRPYDIAIIRVSSPFKVGASTTEFSRLIFQDGQFPYWGEEVPVGITMFGQGISTFATPAGFSVMDGQYRVGFARTHRKDEQRYWFSSGTGDYIAGGDSGGPSFAWVLNGYALMGVHSATHAEYRRGP